MAPVVKQFDNGWFVEKEVTRRGVTYKQWFKITNPEIIAAAQEAERFAKEEQERALELTIQTTRTVEQTTAISQVIEEVSGYYCRRVWWADKLELMQEAWVAVLAALDRKMPPAEYLRGTVARIANRRMAQYLWECSAPVTGTRGHRRLAPFRRASADPLTSMASGAAPDERIEHVDAVKSLAVAREDLYWRILALYTDALKEQGQTARGALLEAVLRVLMDGLASAAAANELGVAVTELYAETNRVKRLIKDDPTCRELLAEILGCRWVEEK